MVSKTYVFLCCFLASVCAEDKYTDKFDNFDVLEALDNDKLRINYIKCFLDQGKCTAEGKEVKSHIHEALDNGCEKCTEIQKNKTAVVIEYMVNKQPESWKELTAKYDPDGVWTKKYEEQARERGINLAKP